MSAARFPAHPRDAQEDPLYGLALRQQPSNPQAEQALLGALWSSNQRVYEMVAETLRPEHFHDPLHGRLFEISVRRIEAGQVADVVTLRPELENDAMLAEAGGPAYLAQLLGAMVGVRNAGDYARVIRDSWHRRQLIALGQDVIGAALEPGEATAADIQEGHEAELLQLVESDVAGAARDGRDVAQDVMERMTAAIERRGGLVGISTGYADLDYLTGGLCGSQLIILGGRPAMGKTAIGAGIALRAAARGARTYFWGGEMDDSDVMMRMVAAEARLPLAAVRRGVVAEGGTLRPLELSGEEVRHAADAARRVGGLPIHWDDQPSLHVAALRSRLLRHKRRFGLDLVVLDYLGLLRGSAATTKSDGRRGEMSEISRALKAMAKELHVPVLAMAQLNRGLEGRDIKRPILADLRDSGDIEQDADTVWFIHREHYFLEKARPVKKPGQDEEKHQAALAEWQQRLDAEEFAGELIIAKQRQGETGTVRLRWSPRRTWYFDKDEPDNAGAFPPDVAA
jgi:replicative DNA helicase